MSATLKIIGETNLSGFQSCEERSLKILSLYSHCAVAAVSQWTWSQARPRAMDVRPAWTQINSPKYLAPDRLLWALAYGATALPP